MNKLVVNVRLWDLPVGALSWDDSQGLAYFEYEPSFIRNSLPISPLKMPVAKGVFSFAENRNNCFRGLPGLVADSLPDKFGDQIISEWFEAMGRPLETVNPLERLCYMGRRSMGALEFEPSMSAPGLDKSTEILVDDLVNLAERIFRDREKFREKLVQKDKTLYDILRVGSSAGGAKPKAIIAYNESTGEVRSGQVPAPKGFGYWLLKFDGVSYSEHDSVTEIPRGIGNVEYAYYKMALQAGIHMSESRILEDSSGCHFMTKRFDRTEKGSKLHMQTLAALSHLDRDVRHSYEEAFATMRKLGLDAKADEDLFRYMVFNVLAKNNDDHTKNISFLMDELGTWKLAPAYDLCYANNPRSHWINRHQMSINMKQENIKRDDLKAVAERIGIRKYSSILDQVENAVASWDEIAKDCGVRKNHREEISQELHKQSWV